MAAFRMKIATLQSCPSAWFRKMTLGGICIVAFFFFCGVAPVCRLFCEARQGYRPACENGTQGKERAKSRASRPLFQRPDIKTANTKEDTCSDRFSLPSGRGTGLSTGTKESGGSPNPLHYQEDYGNKSKEK